MTRRSHGMTWLDPQTSMDLDTQGALARLWWTLALVLLAVLIGGGWDGWWHSTRPFDGFWSPPHLFIYGCSTLAGLVVLSMALAPRIRAALGPAIQVPLVPFPVPGAILILGNGIVLAGIGGVVFDNMWHTIFGLDETSWTTPHAMIGWAECLLALGLIACRLNVRDFPAPRWLTLFFMGLLVALGSAVPVMGPIITNRTPELTRAESMYSVLALQSSSQHAFRILLEWDLMRTNPLLLLLASLWAGALIAFLARLSSGPWLVISVTMFWTLLDDAHSRAVDLAARDPAILQHPANWLPLPLLVPALAWWALRAIHVPDGWAWSIAGIAFNLATFALYSMPLWGMVLVPLAVPCILLGQAVGQRVGTIVLQPTARARILSIVLAGIFVPLLTGGIDLALRMLTA